jgi:hypothetical protein
MNIEVVSRILGKLSVLRFFPADDTARAAILQMVCSMASNEDQVRWLVGRMTSGLYSEWPGPREMRACFCSKFKPADAINAYSEVYADGIPSEKQEVEILPPLSLPEPRGCMVSAAQDVQAAIKRAAELKGLEKQKPGVKDKVINPDAKRITQADIDEAVRQYREKKAKEEIGS